MFALVLVAIVASPFVTIPRTAATPLLRFSLSNTTVQGKVLYVGPSTVSAASAVVLYGYNTPDYPRKPWSFQREQVVAPQDLSRFRPGMAVTVEYANALAGASRLKGYGKTRSVLLDEMGLIVLVAVAMLVVSAFLVGRRIG